MVFKACRGSGSEALDKEATGRDTYVNCISVLIANAGNCEMFAINSLAVVSVKNAGTINDLVEGDS